MNANQLKAKLEPGTKILDVRKMTKNAEGFGKFFKCATDLIDRGGPVLIVFLPPEKKS